MKEKNVNFFKRFNVLPKIFCVLVAFLIWLYVTAVESPDHEETITSVPVELFGVGTLESEHNLSPVSGREIKIDIVVKGQQSTISRYSVEDYKVIADISGLKTAGRHTVNLSFDMPSGVTMSSSSASSIEVYIDENIEADVEVRPSVMYSSEYAIGEYTLDYDVIKVTGPKKYVDEVAYAEVSVNAGKITSTKSVTGTLVLKNSSNMPITSPYLKMSREQVEVTIPVYVTKEVQVKVPYKYGYYSKDTAAVRIEPSTITVEGELSALSSVDYIYTELLDEKAIDGNVVLEQRIDFEKLPPNVRISKSEKETVSVSIQHKATEKKRFSVNSKQFSVIGAEGMNYDIINDSLSVVVRGKSEALKELKADSFKIIIDLTGYEASSEIVEVPYSVEFDAESFEAYVIEANKENIKVKIS